LTPQQKTAEKKGEGHERNEISTPKYNLEPLAKLSFYPNSALCSKFYPRNISYMPVVKFFACLDFE
jgi:hypothetical protein